MKRMRLCCLMLLAGAFPASAETTGGLPEKDRMGTFRTHLSDPEPCTGASSLWRRHYGRYTRQVTAGDSQVLRLFNTVVDKMVSAGLPTEYALIPFIESHYKPDARSLLGPAGLWQFTAATARHHGLKVSGKQDERLDATRATDAAIRYLRYLHRKFNGDEETVLMAFNAGEGRLLAFRRKSGKGLSGITHAYPHKIKAIACNILGRGR